MKSKKGTTTSRPRALFLSIQMKTLLSQEKEKGHHSLAAAMSFPIYSV
ncbi:MAG: hypothetical protein KA314_24150 [Chloroflexi bacterium]|nr:hypothetical protein [Chloroflexota bacterium]